MAISLFIGLLICALTLFLVIEDTYREIVSISIIFLYGILAIMYGVGLYSLETEDRTN
jgi:hypothetical protein